MNFSVVGLEGIDYWIDALEMLPINKRDVYFTPEYYSLYENAGEICCAILRDEINVVIYPYFKNKVNYGINGFDIQGAYGYNGIISNTEDTEFISCFWLKFSEYCKENKIIAEFTRFHPILGNEIIASEDMNINEDRSTVAVDCTVSLDKIWTNSFSSKNRNMIRKAQKEGVEVTYGRTLNHFCNFHKLYISTMEDLNAEGFYFFDKEYFEKIQETIPGAFVFEARLNNQLIGSILVFEYGEYGHYHLSARDRSFSKYAANNLLLFEAIKKAKNNGCKIFHLGGGTGLENDFLLKFKMNFSKTLKKFSIGKKVHDEVVYNELICKWKESSKFNKSNKKLLRYRD